MGGNPSKTSLPSLEGSQCVGCGVGGAKQNPLQPLHQGPVHCLCSVGNDCIASGGADKVSDFGRVV